MANDIPDGVAPPDRVWAQPTMPGSQLSPGMELGRFRVEELIARGGMGEVWKAHDPTRQRPVVVKVLPAQFQGNPQEIARIQQSFQRINALQHQHICPVYDLGEDPRCGHYLVMKYVEGETLAVYRWKYVQQHGSFPLSELMRALRPIAAALDYAHGQKVIHRDIKPQNILVRSDGSDPQLVDFGLAAEIRESASRVSMTHSDTSGTYPYMAPEQWRGQRQDSKADQYSLAVVAYELLCGDPPFTAVDTGILRLCVLQEPIPPIGDQPEQVNAGLAKALAKNPQERFSSCGEFLGVLESSATSAIAPGPRQASTSGPTTNARPSSAARAYASSGSNRGDKAGPASSPSASGKFTLVLLAVIVIGAAIFWKDLFGRKRTVTTAATNAPVASSAPTPPASPAAPLPQPVPGAAVGAQPAPASPSASPASNVAGSASPGQPTSPRGAAPSATGTAPNPPGPGQAKRTAVAAGRLAPPPAGNPVEERAAAMAQIAANQAKGEAAAYDAERFAATEWKAAESANAAALKQFGEYKFPLARDTYKQAEQQYRAAAVAAEDVFNARARADAAQREMIAARDTAASAQAQKLSTTLWSQAEQMQKIAEAELRDSRFESAREKLNAAAEAYFKAKDQAVQLNRANEARAKFNTETANPGRVKLDKYGGTAWLAATKAIDKSEAGKDPQRIADSYEQALLLLPDARELAMDPDPDSPASAHKMEPLNTDLGKLPSGWRATEGLAAVAVSDGVTVLMNQADRRPAVIESPPLRLRGDFFVQVDALWCPHAGRLEVTLLGKRAERDVTFEVRQGGGRNDFALPGAAPRSIDTWPRYRPISCRLEHRGMAYTLHFTFNTSEVAVLPVQGAATFRGIRLGLNSSAVQLTGLRAGPLNVAEPGPAATVPFAVGDLLMPMADPSISIKQNARGLRRVRISGLSIERNFSVEFVLANPTRRPVFTVNLVGRGGGADFPLGFEPAEAWAWVTYFPQGHSPKLKTDDSKKNNRFRIERNGKMYIVSIDGQEVGRQQATNEVGGFDAIEIMDLHESAEITSLRIDPLP